VATFAAHGRWTAQVKKVSVGMMLRCTARLGLGVVDSCDSSSPGLPHSGISSDRHLVLMISSILDSIAALDKTEP
jgi:hypothetical protein